MLKPVDCDGARRLGQLDNAAERNVDAVRDPAVGARPFHREAPPHRGDELEEAERNL